MNTVAGSRGGSAGLELDRKIFQLKALYDTTLELSGVIQPRKIMETFLLMTMGPLGVRQGFVLLIPLATPDRTDMAHRGYSEAESGLIARNYDAIARTLFPSADSGPLAPLRAQVVASSGNPIHSVLPHGTGILIELTLGGGYAGLLGLGEKLIDRPYSPEDLEFLLSLSSILINGLSHALSTGNIRQLNTDLQKKNALMEEALELSRRSRAELDRRVFQLDSLYDAARELSGLRDSARIKEKFLLLAMGAFSASQGFILALDRRAGSYRAVHRGLDDLSPFRLPTPEIERFLFRCFEAMQDRTLAPMTVRPVTDPRLFSDSVLPGLSMRAEHAVMYVIDDNRMGLVVLGPSLAGDEEGSGQADHGFLATHVAAFMTFLRSAQAFETIQALNQDLERRNEALRATIEELTAARRTIDTLEAAKRHIKELIEREAARIGKVAKLDFALILGLGLIIGLLYNAASPHGIPLAPEGWGREPLPIVTAQDALHKLRNGQAVMVDARPPEFYGQGHVDGAMNLPPALFDFVYSMRFSDVDPDTEVIVYGRTMSRLYADEVGARLKAKGYEKVKRLDGGLKEWKEHGLPVAGQQGDAS